MTYAPFLIDTRIGRAISLTDLVFACLVTFLLVPAATFAFGALIVLMVQDGPLLPVGMVLVRLGLTGLVSWIGIPVAIGVARLAANRGLVGWGFAPAFGALSAALMALALLLLDGAFYSAAFTILVVALALYGTAYGLIFWLALRWLRADVLSAAD